ncbi:rod shape-determining protein RodA [Ichthyobacterium seriolicida]|uniref:Rod shape-determining protein RodA n=1 Tax=Ichthyobacterium seriolicida TaxID=242600 RepID=A0A1J1DVY5_9FLAO|nr:rod shape-determining protein RodA [Ichthyobacterium seriolicida]BAV94023.1 rod shape-determining protein RodA [Ichthyobacterium seriolicida]
MIRNNNYPLDIDWILVLLYLSFVVFGWMNIYSCSNYGVSNEILDFSKQYGKQIIWIGISLVISTIILFSNIKIIENLSIVIYIVSVLSLILLYFFGKKMGGATSWYSIQNISIQPSEFAKVATALLVSKYLSVAHINFNRLREQLYLMFIILLPASIIFIQPDPGSALVFSSFFIVLYRENIASRLIAFIIYSGIVFILAIVINNYVLIGILLLIYSIYVYFNRKNRFISTLILVYSFLLLPTTNFLVENAFGKRHIDRINVVLGIDEDIRGIGYNVYQSKIAIVSGGLTGKGYLKGPHTIGKFIPKQSTDFIFSTIGEEWGFIGSSVFIVAYLLLLIRIVMNSELQKNMFSKIYGYCVASILFIHFCINISMSMNLIPVIGIPLPFISYGGSSLISFTVLLFIFIKLDANKSNILKECTTLH